MARSARILECLGFKTLATTSAGYAVTLGVNDGQTSLAKNIRALAAAGVAGSSIEFELQ